MHVFVFIYIIGRDVYDRGYIALTLNGLLGVNFWHQDSRSTRRVLTHNVNK